MTPGSTKPKKKTRSLRGLEELSCRSYWTRLWITQEAFLASNLRLQSRDYCVPSVNLQLVCSALVALDGAGGRVGALRGSRMINGLQ
jgi:hypothetical protein